MRAGKRIVSADTLGVQLLLDLNMIAPPDAAGFNDPAQHSAPSANFCLKTLADFIHLVAGFARLGHFKQDLARSQPLAERQCPERDAARGDVFPHASRRDAEFLERFQIHHQNLAAASAASVDAVVETLVFNGDYFVELPHGLAVRQALK
jgi:hypothetical protein